MNKASILEQLKPLLLDMGGRDSVIDIFPECPTSDLVLRTPCYFAFFVVEDNGQTIREHFKKAQGEIVSARGTKGMAWPRDLNIVFLVPADGAPDAAARREIIDDRHLCRKFVLSVNGDVSSALTELPFGPPGDLFSGESVAVASGVQEAIRGYDPELISDLGSRSPGAERIFDKIQEGAYSITATTGTVAGASPARVLRPSRTKLEGVDITDFRGIRRLRREDMPLAGDVVFVYGPNGVGKTSIADSVEWAISGEVQRLAQGQSNSTTDGPDPVINLFATGETKVSCYLSGRDSISRIKGNQQTERRLIGTHVAHDDRAIIDHVVGTEAPSAELRLRPERLRDLFRGSHLLSQHAIRQFLEQIKPTQRFDILTNMIGADEFVRFREKITSVLRHLRSQANLIIEQSESLKRNQEDISERIRQRQNDFDKLTHLLTAGETPESLTSELLSGLKRCECVIEDAASGKAAGDSAERQRELLALRAETAIRSKKGALDNILVSLKGLEEGFQGYVQAKSRCELLRSEIANAKGVSVKTLSEHQKHEKIRQNIQGQLQGFQAKQAESSRDYANITWLLDILPIYAQRKDTLLSQDASLKGQREHLQKAESAFEDQKRALDKIRGKLREIEQVIAVKKAKEQVIIAILARLPAVRARQQEQEKILLREKQIDSIAGVLKGKIIAALNEVNAMSAKLGDLQRSYDTEAARHDTLSSFLAEIGELVRSAECPLCGRAYASLEEAKIKIGQHLAALPTHLRDLARQLDEAKEAIAIKRALEESTASEMRTLESESHEIAAAKATATKSVQAFLNECATLPVNMSSSDPNSWQGTLEAARKDYSVAAQLAEAASLQEQINSNAAQVAEAQNILEGLGRKFREEETRHRRLADEVRRIEADMVSRGYNPNEIPQIDQLTANQLKVKNAVSENAASIATAGKDLAVAESTIAELRGLLKKTDEDMASKERQLAQYEATCSRFVTTCRAIDVDSDNLAESILAVRKRIADLDQDLSRLEEKRQVLQQVAGLGKVRLEIEALKRSEDELKRKVEAGSKEHAQFGAWVSRIEGLQADVTKGQMDVVSTHLERLEPTTQRLYRRLNPHPVFGNVKIMVDEATRKLDIQAAASLVHERLRDVAVSPSAFFSDAQMNSLAITVFLAGTLRQRWSGLSTILIDDPVQQMDEMNVCAFLDLLRGLSTQRQFIIFTCNKDFYLLALEKLECLNKVKPGAFLAYRLEGVAPSELKVHCDSGAP